MSINLNIKIGNCPLIENEGNAKWEETTSNGEIINGQCSNGYLGFAIRSCIQLGSTSNWTSIFGSCNGILFFFLKKKYCFILLFFS